MFGLVANGFLNDGWRDIIDVVALVGVGATLIGLIVAVVQIQRTRTSAQAAEKAADSTREQLTENLHLSDVTSATRRISDIRNLLGSGENRLARLRLDDLRELLVVIGARYAADPGTGSDFEDSVGRVSALEKALVAQEEDPSKTFSRVRADRLLVEVSDELIRFSARTRLKTGGTDANS